MASETKDVIVALCKELDIEMDGVSVPASAAAVLNAIRTMLTRLESEAD